MFSDKFSLLTLNFKSSTVPVVIVVPACFPSPVLAIKYANVTPIVKTNKVTTIVINLFFLSILSLPYYLMIP